MAADTHSKTIAIIGAGPSGLFAGERLAMRGYKVVIFEQKPSPARKFLMAGRGGLNLTHSEDMQDFTNRYRESRQFLADAMEHFGRDDLVDWCRSLGQETFVGSSGRIFPKSMKASPLLRAWLARLDGLGVDIRLRHRWTGWNEVGEMTFENGSGKTLTHTADAVLLALGGASWPGLGSDGAWAEIFARENIAIRPFRPANCGFILPWSGIFKEKAAGQPLKNIVIRCGEETAHGEIMITENGMEGGAVYALSAVIRDEIDFSGAACLSIDLRPNMSAEILASRIPLSRKSLSTRLKSAGFNVVEISLIHETLGKDHSQATPANLAKALKSLRVTPTATTGLDKSISTAGGVDLSVIDRNMMIKNHPGLFVTGEMIDWEAPTGGYLLQGCFSLADRAARGIDAWLSA